MTTMLILVIVLVLAAWLTSLIVQLKREVTKARRRGIAAVEKERKLTGTIDNMLIDERTLSQRILDQEQTNAELQKRVNAARNDLTFRQTTGRSRLMVLHLRRQAGDKDWIVKVVNPNLLRIDASQPLAQEWAAGRDYLVFARTEQEARERALRRFSIRPGTVIKASMAAPPDLFTASPLDAASSN